MKNRSRPFPCVIAAKTVNISLRHGGGLQEPDKVYVRCDERDCQYVDLNEPPCPLRIEMFADGSDRAVAEHLSAHAGTRFCYACLVDALGITHDQVRRASWHLKDQPGFSIRPSRCSACHRRRVSIALDPAGVEPASFATGGAPALSSPSFDDSALRTLERYLRDHRGFRFCAHCLARELGARPAVVRELMWKLETELIFHLRSGQCVSCLLTKPVIHYEELSAAAEAPRRVIEFLVQSSGLAFCASCVAFSTDLGLAEVRRIFHTLEPVLQLSSGQAACDACGRWQRVMRAQLDAEGDAAHMAAVGEMLGGHLRYRGFRIDLLSYRYAEGWRPFALVRLATGSLIPDAPPLDAATAPTKIEADELAAAQARAWIDKRTP